MVKSSDDIRKWLEEGRSQAQNIEQELIAAKHALEEAEKVEKQLVRSPEYKQLTAALTGVRKKKLHTDSNVKELSEALKMKPGARRDSMATKAHRAIDAQINQSKRKAQQDPGPQLPAPWSVLPSTSTMPSGSGTATNVTEGIANLSMFPTQSGADPRVLGQSNIPVVSSGKSLQRNEPTFTSRQWHSRHESPAQRESEKTGMSPVPIQSASDQNALENFLKNPGPDFPTSYPSGGFEWTELPSTHMRLGYAQQTGARSSQHPQAAGSDQPTLFRTAEGDFSHDELMERGRQGYANPADLQLSRDPVRAQTQPYPQPPPIGGEPQTMQTQGQRGKTETQQGQQPKRKQREDPAGKDHSKNRRRHQ